MIEAAWVCQHYQTLSLGSRAGNIVRNFSISLVFSSSPSPSCNHNSCTVEKPDDFNLSNLTQSGQMVTITTGTFQKASKLSVTKPLLTKELSASNECRLKPTDIDDVTSSLIDIVRTGINPTG